MLNNFINISYPLKIDFIINLCHLEFFVIPIYFNFFIKFILH